MLAMVVQLLSGFSVKDQCLNSTERTLPRSLDYASSLGLRSAR